MAVDARAVIVGGGPVGLAAAAMLGRAGWDVIVLESRTEPTPMTESRAITWMPEGLLFADELGITGDLRGIASVRTRHEFRRHPTGSPLLTVRFDLLDHRHPYTLNLPQHESERLIAGAAQASGHVDVRRGWTVADVHDSADAVSATGTDPAGEAFTVTGGMGIIADGARSLRHGLGRRLHIEGDVTDYGARTVVADVLVRREPADGAVSWVALDPRRPTGAFRFGDRRWRLIYRVNAGEADDVVRDGAMVTRIARSAWGDAPLERILWTSSFRLGQGQARAYSAGRWSLVGDAAHAMGPSAGAGMMVGLLGAWRLTRELTGPDGVAGAFARYEASQRRVSTSVQRGNAMIFRNLAVRSVAVGAIRSLVLAGLGTTRAAGIRLAASEGLAGKAPVTPSDDHA